MSTGAIRTVFEDTIISKIRDEMAKLSQYLQEPITPYVYDYVAGVGRWQGFTYTECPDFHLKNGNRVRRLEIEAHKLLEALPLCSSECGESEFECLRQLIQIRIELLEQMLTAIQWTLNIIRNEHGLVDKIINAEMKNKPHKFITPPVKDKEFRLNLVKQIMGNNGVTTKKMANANGVSPEYARSLYIKATRRIVQKVGHNPFSEFPDRRAHHEWYKQKFEELLILGETLV